MKKLFVGIDISKDFFDYCFLSQDNEILLPEAKQTNDKRGINDFCKSLEAFRDYSIWICMEHTGYYGALLTAVFSKRKFCFSLLNPLEMSRSMGMTRGKTDAIDAFRIASYAMSNTHKLKPYKLPTQQLQQLKVMMSIKNRYSKILVQLKNGLKACEIVAKTIDLEQQIKQNEMLIKNQHQAILEIEKEMNQIIKNNVELYQTFQKISSVIGVGPITAIKCIIETDNFQKFIDPRKFSCHCGLAPFEYQSGTSIRGKTRTSSLSDKSLKGTMFKAACTAIQHDPQIKAYYQR